MSVRRATPAISGTWITGQSARFHYRVVGPVESTDIPIVLVHGLGVSSAYFARLQPMLATHRRVYALDLPGFGRTRPRPRRVLNGVALAAALREWMSALNLPRVHLIGHSLGGPVAIEFARRYPECVARLVLLSPTIGVRGPQAPHQSLGLMRDFLREPPSLFRVLMPDYVRAGMRRIVATDVIVDGEDTVGSLMHVQAPVLIVRGTHDPIVSRADIGQLRGASPLARYHELPDAPHVIQWRDAEPLAAVINGFLAEDDAARKQGNGKILHP